MDRDEVIRELRRLYQRKDDLSHEEGVAWLEQVSGLLHRIVPARAREFDDLTPYVLAPLSDATMGPIWYRIGTIIQAGIVEAETQSQSEGSAVVEAAHTPTASAIRGIPEDQQELLQVVYDHLRKTGNWPSSRMIRIQMRQRGRLEDLCREAGTEKVVCYEGDRSEDTCTLRLGALPYLRGAESDIDNILRALGNLVTVYLNAEEQQPFVSAMNFMTVLGMAEAEARRAAKFLQFSGIWSSYTVASSDGWDSGVLRHDILEFENVTGLESLLSRLHSSPAPYQSPTIHEPKAGVKRSRSFLHSVEVFLRREKEVRGAFWTVLGVIIGLFLALFSLV